MILIFSGPHRTANLRTKTKAGVHRETRLPGSDLSDLPNDIKAEIEKEWTPDVVAAYEAALADAEPVEPTQAEIDEEQTRLIEQQGTTLYALARTVLELKNEVRALKGQEPLTPIQFRTYIKGLLR